MQRPFELVTTELNSSYLAEVVSVQDPDNRSQVQVRLYSFDGVEGHDAPIWARVALPFAGNNRGAFMLPDVGDEVLVTFLNGDARFPIVVGGLWNGSAAAPEELGGDRVDRWTIVGKAGTRIAIVEASPATATIAFDTPNGASGTFTDAEGGKIEFQVGSTTITCDSQGVAIQTSGKFSVQATEIELNAGDVTVNSATSTFSNLVTCTVMQSTTTTSGTYTAGAGNIW
jgi:uncharacterized protein involved in type VI secretion and phage assembly